MDLPGLIDKSAIIQKAMSLDTKLKTECEVFLATFESVLLSTINQDGSPDLSYSPYIDHDGVFYILASHLSAHTPNLIRDSRATLLFIDDEDKCDQIYASRRLQFKCTTRRFDQYTAEWLALIQEFLESFGDIIDNLSAIPDFQIFALEPLGGHWIKGFGKAFNFTGRIDSDATHLNPKKDR